MLISKRELLQMTGISYGQLYRWKREGLIPEEWFQKQSAFTGQETFFERDKILPRIRTILELKERYSLEELARYFAGNGGIAAPTVDTVDTLPLSPSLRAIITELCGDECDHTTALLFTALSAMAERQRIALPDLRALSGALVKMASSIAPNTAGDLTLTLWRCERPRYLLTLTPGTGAVIDPRLEPLEAVKLSEIAAILQSQS